MWAVVSIGATFYKYIHFLVKEYKSRSEQIGVTTEQQQELLFGTLVNLNIQFYLIECGMQLEKSDIGHKQF